MKRLIDRFGVAIILLTALLLAASLVLPARSQFANVTGGATLFHLLSAASNNATNVKAVAGTVYSVTVVNTTTSLGFLRLYDTASTPTCSSSVGVVQNYPVPFGASSAGGGLTLNPEVGLAFFNGIGICFTGGPLADNDNSNAFTGVAINLGYK